MALLKEKNIIINKTIKDIKKVGTSQTRDIKIWVLLFLTRKQKKIIFFENALKKNWINLYIQSKAEHRTK